MKLLHVEISECRECPYRNEMRTRDLGDTCWHPKIKGAWVPDSRVPGVVPAAGEGGAAVSDWADERARGVVDCIETDPYPGSKSHKNAVECVAEALRKVARECAEILDASRQDYLNLAMEQDKRYSPLSAQYSREVAEEIKAHAEMIREKFPSHIYS